MGRRDRAQGARPGGRVTLEVAESIWGPEAVARAIAEPAPAVVDAALVRDIRAKADPPGLLRSWALALPWPRFCAVVLVVSGSWAGEP